MSEKSRQRWILLAIFVLFSILLSVFVYAAYIANDGHIIYVLDDTYIHMAMAKNIVEYGVFGITPYRVSATSSSPFWTLLLALLYGIFGKSEWLPLFLNYLSGLGAI
ncbi:hypothetical protein JXO59_08585, partial [candidate division KSB1 bacterium]|nr:hypothetical protein [candidate division KSB1 bacterium]